MAKQKKKDKDIRPSETPPVLNILDINPDFSTPVETPSVDIPPVEPVTDGWSEPIEPEKPKRKYKTREPKEDDAIPLIDGETLMLLIDFIVPNAISALHNAMADTRISPDNLGLTEKQSKKLQKLADKVSERMRLSANPYVMFFGALGVIYSMNYIKEKSGPKE